MNRTTLLSVQPLLASFLLIGLLFITGCNRQPDISVQIVDGTQEQLLRDQFTTGIDFGFLEDDFDINGEEDTWDNYEWVRLQTDSPDTDRITVVRPGSNTTSPHPGYWVVARSQEGTILGRGYQRLAFSNDGKPVATVTILDWCGNDSNKGYLCATDDNERTICVPETDSDALFCGPSRCGDGVWDNGATPPEACDASDSDASQGSETSCDSDCQLVTARCGDRIVNADEECDEGGQDTETCDSDCTLANCGDEYINTLAGEQCDDKNTNPNDGCHNCRAQIWTPELVLMNERLLDEVSFSYIADINFDLMGNMYVADSAKDIVYRVSAPDGSSFEASTISVLAGGAKNQEDNIYESMYGTRGDGDLARYALLEDPNKILIDGLNNIYILEGPEKDIGDEYDNAVQYVRRIDPSGHITTIISSRHERIQPSEDAQGTIRDIALDGTGQLYLLTSTSYDDSFGGDNVILTLDPTTIPLEIQQITLPPAMSAPIDPEFIFVREAGNIYLTERYTGTIYRLLDQPGVMSELSPVIGNDLCIGNCSVSVGKSALDIYLNEVTDIDISADGKLRASVRWLEQVDKAGIVTFTETQPDEWVVSDITSLNWKYEGSFPISTDPANRVYASDDTNRGIMREGNFPNPLPEPIIFSAPDGICIQDRVDSLPLQGPREVHFDTNGDYYILDTYGYRIYKVNSITNQRYELAGTGSYCYYNDGYECGDNQQEGLIGFSDVTSMALGGSDYLYIADTGNNRIRKISLSTTNDWNNVCDAAGDGLNVQTIIGDGQYCDANDCLDGRLGSNAQFDYLKSIQTDSNGHLYILDNNKIYRSFNTGSGVNGNSNIELILGCEDGAMDCSPFESNRKRVEMDSTRNFAIAPNGDLWIADNSNRRILRLRSTGPTSFASNVDVIAGDGALCTTGDCGNGNDALWGSIGEVSAIRPLSNGQVIFAEETGSGSNMGGNLGLSSGAYFDSLTVIRALIPNGVSWQLQAHAGRNTIAPNGDIGDFEPASEAIFLNITDIQEVPNNAGLDADWVAVDQNLRLIRSRSTGAEETISSIAGAIRWSGDCASDDINCQASFDRPKAMHLVQTNDESAYWVVDAEAGRIRQFQRTDDELYSVETVLGYPGLGYLSCFDTNCEPPENLAPQPIVTHRTLVDPAGIVQDPDTGAVYISEQQSSTGYWDKSYGSTIHCVDEPFDGPLVSFFAGSANGSGYSNGSPLNSQFNAPAGLAVHNNYLYIADSGNHVIRRIGLDPNNPCQTTDNVETIAGIPMNRGYLDDDGRQATLAYLNNPQSVAINQQGDIYIADTDNNRVRRIASDSQMITTVAGHGTLLGAQLPGARYTDLQSPNGLLFDSFGNLFITSSNTVKMITPGEDDLVTGEDPIFTVFPRSPNEYDNDVVKKLLISGNQKCLTALALETGTNTDDTLHALDECNGNWITLRRGNRLGE